MNKENSALVLGMYETGLGVVRSLGQTGIAVYGLDYHKDIAFYSKYCKAGICPHPIEQEAEFISFMVSFAKKFSFKPVLYITSDAFLMTVSRNQSTLKSYYLFDLVSDELMCKIVNKYEQYKLVQQAGAPLPLTYTFENLDQLDTLKNGLPYPIIIKALDVNIWRGKLGGSIKGFVAKNAEEFIKQCTSLLLKGIKILVQEIINGPDTNHYKYCAYYSSSGEPVCEFTLRKIRQSPIHFGIGAVVESIKYNDLLEVGRRLFRTIGYQGVGSVEFKFDERDRQLKLIEINPRYWQQNYLSTACGMNFPLINYQALTEGRPELTSTFTTGIKWVNRYMDFNSFLEYRKEKTITFKEWRKSLRGKKVYSDFSWDDPLPFGYEIRFGKRLFKIPKFIIKKTIYDRIS